MKRILRIFLLTFIAFHCGTLVAADADNDADWVLVTEDNDIKVFERWVSLDKQRARERSGKMLLNCTPADLLAVLTDVNKVDYWMSNVEECHVINRSSDDEWFVYTVMDAPWPVGKQDFVSKYVITRKGDRIILDIRQQTGLVPKKKNIERLDTFSASWEIVPISDNIIDVRFTTQSTQPAKYPNWVQDPIVRKTFLQNMRKLRRHMNKG